MQPTQKTALDRQKRDPSFRILPVELHPDDVPAGEMGKELCNIQWLTAWKGDIQDVSLRIRRLLGTAGERSSSTERRELLEIELEQALNEKIRLTEETNQLQAELNSLSKDKGVMEERIQQLTERFRKQRRKQLILVSSFMTTLLFSY